jgi:hypothetical protein
MANRNRRLAGAAVILCAAQALLLVAGVLHTVADARADVIARYVVAEVLVAVAALAAVPAWLLAARGLSTSPVEWRRLRLAMLVLAFPAALQVVRGVLYATMAFGDPYPTSFALQFVLVGCSQLVLAVALALGAFLLEDEAGGARRNRILAGVAAALAAGFALEAAAYFILESLYSGSQAPAGETVGFLLSGSGSAVLAIAAVVAVTGFVAAGRAQGARLDLRESGLLAAGSLAVIGNLLLGAGLVLQATAIPGSSFGTVSATAVWAEAGYAFVTATAFAFATAASVSGRRSLARAPQQ